MLPLQGKRTLVAGGAGDVGEGVVRAFLDQGATAIVPSRSEEKLDALRTRLNPSEPDRLITVGADVGAEDGARELRFSIRRDFGGLDDAVASLGGWWQGHPLTRISLDLWQQLLDDSLTAHFVFAKTFLPVLAEQLGSSYTLINGAGGLWAVPSAGPVSVFAAAQLMLKDVLAAENPQVRVNTLVLASPVRTRPRPKGPSDRLTARGAGAFATYLASDAAGQVRGETILFEHRSQLPEPGLPASHPVKT